MNNSQRRVSDVPSLGKPGILLLGILFGAVGALAWIYALHELVCTLK